MGLKMTRLVTKTLTITSPAFQQNDLIPKKYSCYGDNINPPLKISDIPQDAKSLALILQDPDVPSGPSPNAKTFIHWVMWNIPTGGDIKENTAPGIQGLNGQKQICYTGMCPPKGVHRYFFKVYALDTVLDLPQNTPKEGLEKAMKGHYASDWGIGGII
jgi:Raf kinase inhibitor-like YbhB/YbcL family protein